MADIVARAPVAQIDDRSFEPPMSKEAAMEARFRAQQTPGMGWGSTVPPARPPYNPLQGAMGAAYIGAPSGLASGEIPQTRLSEVSHPTAQLGPRDVTPPDQRAENLRTIAGWKAQAADLLKRGVISQGQYNEIMAKMARPK